MTPETPMTKKEIEPVLLKNIINKARVNFRTDISEAELNGWCKWYLINSTKCYEGLIDGINELLSGRVAELEKENDRLKKVNAESYSVMKNLLDKITDEGKDIDYARKVFRIIENNL